MNIHSSSNSWPFNIMANICYQKINFVCIQKLMKHSIGEEIKKKQNNFDFDVLKLNYVT